MKHFFLILIIPVLISCTAAQGFDDGTNGSTAISSGVLSDDGTTAFVTSFYNNEAPLISKNLKEESSISDSKSSSEKTDTQPKNLSEKSSDKITKENSTSLSSDKESKPEIKIVSTKEENKNNKTKESVNKNNNSKDKSTTSTKDKKPTQDKVSKDIPLFLYPVEKEVIKKEYASSGNDKNSGIDFSVGTNENIYASASGVVIFAGEKNSLGKSVFIYHDKGYISIYYNLSSISVTKGSSVSSANNIIGTASSSFHFEIRKQSSSGIEVLNPKNILQKRRK